MIPGGGPTRFPFKFDCLNDWGVHEPSGFEFKYSGAQAGPYPDFFGHHPWQRGRLQGAGLWLDIPTIKAIETKFVIETKRNMVLQDASGLGCPCSPLAGHLLPPFWAWDS